MSSTSINIFFWWISAFKAMPSNKFADISSYSLYCMPNIRNVSPGNLPTFFTCTCFIYHTKMHVIIQIKCLKKEIIQFMKLKVNYYNDK